MDLSLKKFDIKSLKDDKVVVFIGKRETGKSFLVKDLLYHNQDIPIGTVISATESANTFYGNMIPNLFIWDEYTPEIVANVMKRQKQVIKEMKREFSGGGSSDIDPRAFLILDDCIYDNSWTKDKNVRSLFMNGRHFKMLFIITMQYALGIPPNLRTNVDYVFILRESYLNNRKRLYEHYAGMFPSFETFCQVMDQCTSDFECLVINNNCKSSKIEEMVFWYKADPHEDFRVGAPEFWEHHDDNYKFGSDSDEEVNSGFDPNLLRSSRKGPAIHVKKSY